MKKSDLAARLQSQTGMTGKKSQELLDTVLDLIKETLIAGDDLRISGFGSFEVRKKAARKGRNPQTGATITIEAKRSVSFKPSIVLKESINKK